ncbi:NRDE family protein [Marinomonas sp. C2222]|uniref:NRDE family protein n=1 Tax=Marinomonas sargassi TaxID=2984494 RepID=A0ABT2YUW0_9GAMM|nr:NRDE family protein [Marinomonas sargassi]MCV2403676.1 NRDE family protein [Marinomonas sargassi]
MCSVSWLIEEQGYQIFFNRDEQKTREKALPPRTLHMDDAKVLMPVDPVGQGSWISTNDMGLSLCLLNNYQAKNPKEALFSRGLLLKQLSKEGSVESVCEAFTRLTLPHFAPFILLAFDLDICQGDKQVMALEWNGLTSLIHEADSPLFSSGVDLDNVTQYRRGMFDSMVGGQPTPQELHAFHRQHHPDHPHMSVCMHRDDAETVSFTQVIVSEDSQKMLYVAGSPCQNLTSEALEQNVTSLPSRHSALALA